MNASQKKIIQFEFTIHALEELLAVSESLFLKESQKHEKLENDIEQILDASSDAIRVIDNNYNMIYTSRSFNLLHGHPENIIGKKCYDVVPEKECFTEQCSLKRVLRTGKRFAIERELESSDGTKVPYHIDVIPYTDPNGEVAGIIKNYRDITESRQAEEKLREEIKKHKKLEEEYRTLFESSGDAIMILDSKGFINCNKATLKLFGFSSKKQFIKKHPGGDLSPAKQPGGRDSFTMAEEHIKKACREGINFFEWLHIRQDGTTFPAEVLLSRMEHQDNIVQATVRDISERKYVEQEIAKAQKTAEENAQQQGRIEMANNMLHDVGNAMTGISSYVLKPQMQMEKVWQEIQSLYQLRDLFADSENELIKVFGKEKQQALSDFMKALIVSFEERNARHLEFSEKISAAVGHVCSVLDLQRYYLKENASPLVSEINPATIISDTLVMMSGSLHKRNIKVSLDAGDKKLWISGDQTRLIRVFLNIIKNTCEAFDEMKSMDGRKLEITISPDESKKEIKVVFSDNAIGFTPETGKKLFERGFTLKPYGSGIGLHACRAIIESHGGTMTVESNGINTGALTVITFPISK